MSVAVQLTYDMSKAFGAERFDVEGAATVGDVVREARARFGDASSFDELTSRAAIAVNGVLVKHQKGLKTAVSDGDTVAFVKAAAGG